ncbi:MAG: RNA polymerase sigma-70 factor [Ktedonobacteraceae bacterium]|nr:RNA polymerase sigma-70 factor [Ktedonobacteraceae bacterium]
MATALEQTLNREDKEQHARAYQSIPGEGSSVESFETYRPYLFSIAYRMLGSAMDAEDMVQETFIRYQSADPSTIRSLKAFLSTILVRLCMDQLQLAHRKREEYIGPWLPEPILTVEAAEEGNPEKAVEMQESISLAFLVMLEQLQPFERAVFLLREVFGYEFAEIANLLDKTEAASRKSFSRAKQHLQEHRPRFPASRETHKQLLTSYVQAVEAGEIEKLTSLLTRDVVLWTDSGGKTRQAALNPIRGQNAVARFSLGTKRFWPENFHMEMADVNGAPAMLLYSGDRLFSVLTIEVDQDRIKAVRFIANPDKLAHM